MAAFKLVTLVCALITPALSRPAIGAYNTGAYNPGVYNPGVYNPGAYNSGVYNPGAYHSGVYNPGAYNSGVYNPGAYNSGYAPGNTFDPHPRYNYDYRVAEPRTGDYKSAQESRDGDAVRGSYSVAEPDGSLLTVRYAADDAHGYTAVVERSGQGGTVVNTFPGPAPVPVAPIYAGGQVTPVAPIATAYAPPARPLSVAPFSVAPAAHHPFSGSYGTTGTSFSGPHASYHY